MKNTWFLTGVMLFARVVCGAEVDLKSGGDFASASVWSKTPVAGDDLRMFTSATLPSPVLTLSDDFSLEIRRMIFKAVNGTELVFDGENHVLSPATSSVGRYDTDYPICVFGSKGYVVLEVKKVSDTTLSPYVLSNAYLRLASDADTGGVTELSRGVFNVRDPAGIDPGREVTFGQYEPSHTLKFSGDSRFLASQFKFTARGRKVSEAVYSGSAYTVDFAGGKHEIGTLVLGGDATFPIPEENLSLVVRDGAELSVPGEINMCYSGLFSVTGGKLTASKLDMGTGATLGGTNRFRMTGGHVTVVSNKISDIALKLGVTRGSASSLELCGGVLETAGVYTGLESKLYGGTGNGVRMVGDGGTLRSVIDADATWRGLIFGVDLIECGEKGLTVDTAGHACRMYNFFLTNRMESAGLFVKKGRGTLKFVSCKGFHPSRTVVEEGALLLTDQTNDFATSLYLGEGTELSLAGSAETLRLASLSVTNAVVELDPTDTVTVTGGVSFKDPVVRLTSTPVSGAEPLALLEVEGHVDESDLAAWRDAVLVNLPGDGNTASFTAEYDEASGKTVFRAAIVPETAPTEKTSWIAGSGAWLATGNWSDGVPGFGSIASFGTGSVTIDIGDEGGSASALEFTDGGITLEGAALTLDGESATARIGSDEGTVTIAAPVAAKTALAVDVADAAELVLSGGLSVDKAFPFVKTGEGMLTVEGPLDFGGILSHEGGVLGLCGADGDGEEPYPAQKIVLRADKGAVLSFLGGVFTVPVEWNNSVASISLFAEEGDTVLAGAVTGTCSTVGMRVSVKEGATLSVMDWMCANNTFVAGEGLMTFCGRTRSEGVFLRSPVTVRVCTGDFKRADGVMTLFQLNNAGAVLEMGGSHFNDRYGAVQLADGVFDLNGYNQRVGNIYPHNEADNVFAKGGEITSALPAELSICGNTAIVNSTYDIAGRVSLVYGKGNTAAKEYTLGRPVSTCGSLSVVNGRFVMSPDASWLNATSATVRVSGTGVLSLQNSGQFHKTSFFVVDGDGVVELADGVRQSCSELYLDGSDEPCAIGTWGAAESSAQYKSGHFSGTGILRVRGSIRRGLRLIVR